MKLAEKQAPSFVFLRGVLVGPKTHHYHHRHGSKGSGADVVPDSVTLIIALNEHRIQVKLRGPGRVASVKGAKEGDVLVVMGNLESHYNTRTRSHLAHVRGIVVLQGDETEGVNWEEFGLATMLARFYEKLSREE